MKLIVEEVINNWDPLDLFPCAPKDEYKKEIEAIALLFKGTNNIQNLSYGIQNIFIESFGNDVFKKGYNECLTIANSILQKSAYRLGCACPETSTGAKAAESSLENGSF